MRFLIGIMASAILIGSIGSAFAHEGYVTNCSNAPQSEWAKCVIDQSQESDSQ